MFPRFSSGHRQDVRRGLKLWRYFLRPCSIASLLLLAGALCEPGLAQAAPPKPKPANPGADAMRGMIIVERKEGQGSGFLVRMDGRIFLVTNSHVIRGESSLKFKTLVNQELRIGGFQIAEAADL